MKLSIIVLVVYIIAFSTNAKNISVFGFYGGWICALLSQVACILLEIQLKQQKIKDGKI